MKTAIRKYLLARRLRKLAQHLQFLQNEAARNKAEQDFLVRKAGEAQAELLNLELKSRREMMV